MKDTNKGILETILKHISDQNEKMFRAIADIEKKHFEELQKTSTKQFESFMSYLSGNKSAHEDTINSNSSSDSKETPIDFSKFENDIAKKDEEEIPLSEMPRIPIVEGVNVRFEDDKESFPVNIESPSAV